MALYRHGDLLLKKVRSIPDHAKPLQHLVLAEGELTGHSHRIAEKDAARLYQSSQSMYLWVTVQPATLIHQEHGPIALSQGKYRVWRQREYSPQEIHFVRD